MGYYIGHFYFSVRDFFLLAAAGLLAIVVYLGFSLPFFDTKQIFTLVLLALVAKGLLLPAHDSVVFLTFFVALALTLFIPFLQVLIFLLLSFILLHVTKVI